MHYAPLNRMTQSLIECHWFLHTTRLTPKANTFYFGTFAFYQRISKCKVSSHNHLSQHTNATATQETCLCTQLTTPLLSSMNHVCVSVSGAISANTSVLSSRYKALNAPFLSMTICTAYPAVDAGPSSLHW